MADQVTPELLKSIYPLNQLPQAALDALMPHMRIRWQSSGRDLFRIGDTPSDYFYVLEGSVWLTDQKEEEFQTVGPVSEGDAIPLPYLVPSIHHARINTDAKLLLVDRVLLLKIVSEHQPKSAQAVEQSYRAAGRSTYGSVLRDDLVEGSATPTPGAGPAPATAATTDWQAAFLRAPGFQRVAPHDLRRAFELMKPVKLQAGDIVIEQGTPADFFYVVAEGRVEVLRSFIKGGGATRVSEYGPGATLGEDALISGALRNGTVRMQTDGTLMRLDGDDFRFLIKRTLVRGVDFAEAQGMVARGSRWLDVRMPEERKPGHLPNSIMIPHPVVRGRLFTADPQLSYVVVCARGFDAPVIAFTLCKYGFDAYHLKGGIEEVPQSALQRA